MCAVGSRVSARGRGAVPREVAPSRACGGQRGFLAGGQGEPLMGALPVGCTTTQAGLHNPAWRLTHASPGPEGTAVQVLPYGTNNSWRTNNLTRWSTGGKPSWGASLAALAWPCFALPTGSARSRLGTPARQRRGVAPVAEPPHPQHRSRGPPGPTCGRQLSCLPAALGAGDSGGGRQGRL